ncbi:hypothetical protein [Mycolicibacterium flavescens]|uniref:NAD-dependent epimerase/dehydratase domain-containing protein n=1 Tax=Mycolicibacterium flavescens TaxID=1776 RepID=A0A1E3RCP6_MYCFV|nr:hypothetical protein [Mycolicibacterium flavescens]ODQ87167.1 hypothetical protein BHQ18_24715 [Mycolicibacterium flavescens]
MNALRTQGTANLLDAAAALGARRFVTQSLILGYGLADHGGAKITEERPFGVLRGDRSDPAIAAMAGAENLAFAAEHVDVVALRYGIFYGPGASDMFVTMLKRRMLPLPARRVRCGCRPRWCVWARRSPGHRCSTCRCGCRTTAPRTNSGGGRGGRRTARA